MKLMFHAAAVVSLVAAATAVQAQDKKSDDSSKVTLTGCLQGAGGNATVGTSGASRTGTNDRGAASDRGPFMLVNAKVGGAPGGGSGVISAAPPGSGATEQSVRAGSGAPSAAIIGATDKNGKPDNSATGRYMLRSDSPELGRHVGQEVEISGNYVSASATTANANANANANRTGAGASTEVDVKTVRMIASVCVAP